MNLAWAPAQAFGSAAGGALAKATNDALPYLILSAVCVTTLAVLGRLWNVRSTPGVAREKA